MTPEKQRVAIAEACGWTSYPHEPKKCFNPDGLSCYWSDAPDFLNDLNACAQFEATLTEREGFDYVWILAQLCNPNEFAEDQSIRSRSSCDSWLEEPIHEAFKTACAKPAMRCEAFLRVKGLWEEAKP